MLARKLPRDDYEHMLICQESVGVLPDLLRAEGWVLREIGVTSHILSPWWHAAAARIAREFRPDIVHGAVIEGVALANGIGLRMPGVPVISEETSDPVNRSWRGNFLMRGICVRSDVVIGVSPKVACYLRDAAKIPQRKIKIINNAVLPPPSVKECEIAALRAAHGINADDRIIGSVGRVDNNHKRFSDLIRALVALRSRFPKVKLLIVGDGPDLEMLRALAVELGVAEAIIFTGYQGEARRFYPLMDVFALVSEHEAFGLVLVEAMLAGIPVVATEVGGMPFVLGGGSAGRLVPVRSPHVIAQVISELLANEEQRVSLGALGKSHAELEFSADRYCNEIDALYKGLAS